MVYLESMMNVWIVDVNLIPMIVIKVMGQELNVIISEYVKFVDLIGIE